MRKTRYSPRRLDQWCGVGWLVFHLLGTTLSLLYPSPMVVGWYAAVFLLLEIIGLYFGQPMTRHVRWAIEDARAHSTLDLATTASAVLVWCGVFSALFLQHGWLGTVGNSILATAFFIYIIPHFFGETW